jgi:putative membrane protein
MGAQALRVWNEVATLFLVAVVFLVVCKTTLSALNATLGLVVFAALLMGAIVLYKRLRNK